MRPLRESDLLLISGGKNSNEYYEDVVKPISIGAGAAIGGIGGAAAATIILYGTEGFLQIAPELANSLEQMNHISDAELEIIMNNPYGYAD